MTIDYPTVGDASLVVTSRVSGLPVRIDLVVFDFDGVFTDNRVLVLEDGREAVFCHRGDGLGVDGLRSLQLPMVILSTETNPVVAARANKLKLPCLQGLSCKREALQNLMDQRGTSGAHTVFLGNDINDLAAMGLCAGKVCPSDAVPQVKSTATLVLNKSGGNGAVREFSDLVLESYKLA